MGPCCLFLPVDISNFLNWGHFRNGGDPVLSRWYPLTYMLLDSARKSLMSVGQLIWPNFSSDLTQENIFFLASLDHAAVTATNQSYFMKYITWVTAQAQRPKTNMANIAENMAKVPNSMAKRLVVNSDTAVWPQLPSVLPQLLMLFLTCQNPRQRMKDCV